MSVEGLVSVVIPAYNAQQYIRETLESALNQTYRNLEVIVVNDGSTDSTPEIVREFEKRDSRVRLHSQTNAGLAATRNQGIRLSHGSWIAPLDADDIWYPQKIQKQIEAASGGTSEQVGVVYGWTKVIDKGGALLFELRPEEEGEVFTAMLFLNFVGHGSGPLIKRKALDDVGAYDLTFFSQNAQGCEDWDLYLRLARKYRYRIVRDFMVGYRITTESMSRDCEQMVRSYGVFQQKVRTMFPDIPAQALRWSQSDFYFRQARKARRNEQFTLALKYALLGSTLNPLRLCLRDTYRLIWHLATRRPVALVTAPSSGGKRTSARRGELKPGAALYNRAKKRLWSRTEAAIEERVHC